MEDHSVIPEVHYISETDGMLVVLPPVISLRSFPSQRPGSVTFQQIPIEHLYNLPLAPSFPSLQNTRTPPNLQHNATHQPHKTSSHDLTTSHLHPHILDTIRALALPLRDNSHILSNSGRNIRVNGTCIPAR